jgi:hypothetical protein
MVRSVRECIIIMPLFVHVAAEGEHYVGLGTFLGGMPPDCSTIEDVGDLLVIIDGEKRAVHMLSDLSLQPPGMMQAHRADVQLGSRVQLIPCDVLAAVLVQFDVLVRAEKWKQREEEARQGRPHAGPTCCRHHFLPSFLSICG